MGERPDWDDYYLAGAAWAATRSTCPRRSVGAVIVSPSHRIIGTGYNGAPPGLPHCESIVNGRRVGCLMREGHCIRAVHAEENALFYVGERERLVGATIYLDNGTPCYRCARAIVAVGIARVVCRGDYHDPEALELLVATTEVRRMGI